MFKWYNISELYMMMNNMLLYIYISNTCTMCQKNTVISYIAYKMIFSGFSKPLKISLCDKKFSLHSLYLKKIIVVN